MSTPTRRLLGAANALAFVSGLAALALHGTAASPTGTDLASDPRLSTADAVRRVTGPDLLLGDDRHVTAPGDFFDAQRTGPDGAAADPATYARAMAEADAVAADTARRDPALAKARWQLMGPTAIGGRVLDIAVDATEDNTLYIATATGGVWKSTDGGTNYTPSWPGTLTQSIGALAVGRDGTIYAGTGEAGPGGGSVTFGGTGMYRSRDKGRTWTNVGLKNTGGFGRIVVDPKNPKRVFAAATGNLYRPGGQRGVYRSLDGGSSWTLVLPGANQTTGAADLAIDPGNPLRMYATTWDRVRYPTHRVYGGRGSGFYRSLDGGGTWTRVVDGPTGESPADTGRISVAVAASNSSRLYALVIATNGRHGGFFRSDDAGATWAVIPDSSMLTGNSSTYGWWFGRLFVDPADAQRVFVPGVELIESRDGGVSFIPHSSVLAGVATGLHQVSVHADQHAMVWHPRVAGLVYLGNDGGMYRSRANGLVGTWVAGVSQGWTQHYSVGVSRQQPGRIVTGLQDNLCQRSYLVGGVSRPESWTKYGLCGDGLQTLVNPKNDLSVYGCSQYGSCTRSLDGGFSFQSLGATTSDRRGWWAPLQFDPTNPDVMYYGGNVLNRSTNGGASWTAISEDLSTDPEQLDPDSGYHIYGVITWVAASPADPKRLVVGTDEGLVWTTRDLGETWTKVRAPRGVTAKAWVTRVAFDPADPNVFYVTYSGYRSGAGRAHVLRTADFGRTFRDISGNLPGAPVNEIVPVGRSTLLVGTDVGVYVTRDGGARWSTVGANLPRAPILDLDFDRATDTLTAATFGRGVMRVVLPDL
ncbi:MAG TPA: hypothetical protein VNB94_00735 [Mycobacteriales bacterium]|nr:hypothetical protein [Mycobacteriales bacterium]